ncbi:dolichyl-phosphate-mannose-protein mannosyltransferase [Neolewinella xylanilytica]|uniref:Dolichyl-phosphate-mannose-protein mannosyltransferase n=1 Tax=Neolewinella xylanilytica TaxID=1514080 RepID=A0A2S6I9F2_9BACT|nr:glycosyltransferase family 39 protein [Neolewinella xylanilytica]PPK88121.1 dolichyl-phosphate-mannose-protein mannosyltransferase [Neolewinella xylanilytica]
MLSQSVRVRPYHLLLAWLLLNMLQAAFTPLDPDETYYWMYAGRLDWGYFDHPPAVALLIALGKDWLPGSLGLRFGHVLAGGATLTAIYYLVGRPRGVALWTLAALAFAQPMLQVYGFIATPDGPLLLFTALYLLAFRNYLQRLDLPSALIWGVTMAGLLYSKYHGLMLIFFTVLPSLVYLIQKPSAWVAALTGACLFLPHLYWQYAHDFPSFRYHLSGRDDPYQFKFTTQYLLNQLLIFSPFLLYHYWLSFTRVRPQDRFGRSLRWLVGGMLLFFLYSTTKGRTEAQWTALLSIPLVYITFRAVEGFPEWRKNLLRLCWLTGGILVVARLLLMAPREWLPFEKPFDHQPWVERLQTIAGSEPVIVENSYRYASLYEFYSGGNPSWTFTDVAYRPSQYDIWQRDTVYHNQPVWLLGQGNWKFSGQETFRPQKGELRLRRIENFQVIDDVALEAGFPTGSDDSLRVYVTAPREVRLDGDLPIDLYLIDQEEDGAYRYQRLYNLSVDRLLSGKRTLLYAGRIPAGFAPTGTSVLPTIGLGYRGMPPLRDQQLTYLPE